MFGGSEFRLRQGFTCGKAPAWRIGTAGQKAGRVVPPYLFGISKHRYERPFQREGHPDRMSFSFILPAGGGADRLSFVEKLP